MDSATDYCITEILSEHVYNYINIVYNMFILTCLNGTIGGVYMNSGNKKTMIKNGATLAATVAVTGVVGAMATNQVHADTTDGTQATSTAPDSSAAASQALDQAKQNVATDQKVVNQASATNDQAQSAATSANTDVTKAQSDATVAGNAVDQAQSNADSAAAVSANATPIKISDTQAQVTSAKQDVTAATTQKAADQPAVTSAQANVDQARTAARDANQAVTAQQGNIATAQTAVDQAQKAVNATDVAKAQTAVNNASAAVDTAQTNAKQAVTDQGAAKTALDNAQKTLTNATADQGAAKTANDQAQGALTDATNANTAATKAVDGTQAQLNALNTPSEGVHQTITVPSGITGQFVNDIYAKGNGAATDAQQALLLTGVDANKYVDDPAAEAININGTKDITPAMMQELNEYALDLINQIRNQLGVTPLVLTKDSEAYANEVVKNYENDGWVISENVDVATGSPHDVNAVSNAAKAIGLKYGGQYYENAETGYTGIFPDPTNWSVNAFGPQQYTLNDLKAEIYNCVIGMVFDDGAVPGHMTSLTGAAYSGQTEYFGFGVDNIGQLHLEIIPESLILHAENGDLVDPANEFDTTPIVTANDNSQKDALNKTLAIQKATAAKKASALTDAQNNATKTSNALTAANNAVTAAQTKVNDAKTAVTKADQAVTDTANALISAKQALAVAQTTLANSNKGDSEKTQALTDAQSVLSDAKSKLSDLQVTAYEKASALKAAQKTLTDAQGKVTADDAAITAAQAKVDALAQILADMNNAAANVKTANDALANAQKTLAGAQQAVLDAQAIADEANSNAKTTQVVLDTANAALSAAQAQLAKLQHQADVQQQLDDNIKQQTIGSVNKAKRSVITNYVNDWGEKEKNVAKTQLLSNNSTSNKEKLLPKTGNENESMLAVMGTTMALLMGMLGFGVLSRRRRF